MDKIHFIMTGGTIDSYFDGKRDAVVPNEKSIIPDFVKNLNLPVEHQFTTVCMKDSRDITDEDRKLILEEINKSDLSKFIITHGTYTMPDTARYIKNQMQLGGGRTIVLTGSFVPFSDIVRSDGAFNLGFAIGKIETLLPGVYVLMNGKVIDADNARKIISEGKFAEN